MGLRGPGDKEGRLPALPLRSPPRRPARCPARRDLGPQDLGPGIQGDHGPRGRRRLRHRSRPTVRRVQGQRSGRARGEQSSSQAKSTAEERQLTAGPRPGSGILRTGLPSSVTLSRQNHRPRKMSKGGVMGRPRIFSLNRPWEDPQGSVMNQGEAKVKRLPDTVPALGGRAT